MLSGSMVIQQSEKLISDMSQAVTLVTNRVCPFAQRAWLTLLEKEVEFSFRSVDLKDKEPWFTQTYLKAYAHDATSNGKVPILIHGDTIITESDLISWYVAQSFTSGSELIPKDTFLRLQMRRFIQEVVGKLITAFYSTAKLNDKSEEDRHKVVKLVHDNLRTIQSNIVGPYVLGEAFSLADILLYPWFERWCVIQHYTGLSIPEDAGKIKGFIKAMQSRASVQKALSEVTDQFYIQGYKSYF